MVSWESTLLPGVATRPDGNPPSRPIKILVADDDPRTLGLLEAILTSHGDRVITAGNGFDALDRFIMEQPDLVLMDVLLPGMNGFEATRKIKTLSAPKEMAGEMGGKWVPVVILSALDDPDDFAQGLEAGADDYLTKPFTPALLATKIKFLKRVLAIQADLFALKRFQAIFDHVLDGIIATDERGIIVSFNHAAEQIFGYRADEVLGHNVSMLMPIPDSHRHDAYMARYEFSGQATVMGQGRDIHGRRKDGTIMPISVGLTEVQWAGARHFIGVVSDISERKRAERFQQELTAQLRGYHERNEEEKQVTQELLHRIIRQGELEDPLLQWHIRPSEMFSGDIIAAHRARDGGLFVLVADGTGHGLAAAISLLPVVGIFYAMADKGFCVSDIVSEINKRLYDMMPVGRFLAAIVIAVDEKIRQLEIWHGGMPDILLFRNGEQHERLPSNHLALGILPPQQFDAACHRIQWQEPGYLVTLSDGVIEAKDRHGTVLGMEAVCAAVSNAAGKNPFPLILACLDRHLAGATPHDDISLAAIRLS